MSSYLVRPRLTLQPYRAAAGQGIVRTASLLGAAPLLRERGVEPADMLVSVGLDPGTLDEGKNCIPYTKLANCSALSRRRAACISACSWGSCECPSAGCWANFDVAIPT